MAYGSDVLTGGTASASTIFGAGYEAAKACDDDDETRWASEIIGMPHWWKYDLGAAVTKTVTKLTIKPTEDTNGGYIKGFTLAGSNNDSDWDNITTDQHGDNNDLETFTFANSTAYRYYRITITSNWNTESDATSIWETEMMEFIVAQVIFLE